MSLPSLDEVVSLALQGLLFGVFAALWSLLMAVLVAPRTVTRYLRKKMDRINDPADPFAKSLRRTAGSIFGMTTAEIDRHPELLSPVVGAFWKHIRARAVGAKGGFSTVVPEDMMQVAMEEGPEAIAGLAEMFGVSGRAAKAFGKMAVAYGARQMGMGGEGNGQILPMQQRGEGGREWWEYPHP